MSNYKSKVLELVKQRPGVRSIQISDLLDLDLDIVESILAQAIREEVISVDVITGANSLPTKTYRWTGAASPDLGKKDAVAAVQLEVQQSTAAAPVVGPQAAPAEATTRLAAVPSKASIAIDYLALNGPTDRATLKTVMGISRNCTVEQYLKPHIKSGKVVRIEDVYCIPDRPAAAAAATNTEHHPVCDRKFPSLCNACNAEAKVESDPVHAPAHYMSGGNEVIDILRARLTPDEFQGYLKGNVIKHTLCADPVDGAQDYKAAGIYVNLLAQHSATTKFAAQPI